MPKTNETVVTEEQVQAFLAAKAAKEAADKAKAKADKAKPKTYDGSYRDNKKKAADEYAKQYKGLLFHTATFIKKSGDHAIGDSVEVIWIGANRFLKPACRALKDGIEVWCNPAHLKAGKPLSDAKKASIEAAREAETSATLTIPVSVIKEVISEEENGGYVVMKYHDFAQPLRLARKLVSVAETLEDGRVLAEVPVWFIRQRYGDFAVTVLESRQDEYLALAS